jgi:hypothetical protein
MPGSEYPTFDPDATLDEFGGVGKNRRSEFSTSIRKLKIAQRT